MGAIHSTKIPTGPTGKSGSPQTVDQFFREPKFPEILVDTLYMAGGSHKLVSAAVRCVGPS